RLTSSADTPGKRWAIRARVSRSLDSGPASATTDVARTTQASRQVSTRIMKGSLENGRTNNNTGPWTARQRRRSHAALGVYLPAVVPTSRADDVGRER